jgi:DNA mismatch endonuclease (patch repair protein)
LRATCESVIMGCHQACLAVMTDVFDTAARSRIMSRVRSTGTSLEIRVRQALRTLQIPFRSQPRHLPGSPDFVLPSFGAVVFAHGCFWHGHEGCASSRRPSSHTDYWQRKLDRNRRRDRRVVAQLRKLGWRVLIVWECRSRDPAALARQLRGRLSKDRPSPRRAL